MMGEKILGVYIEKNIYKSVLLQSFDRFRRTFYRS